MSTIARALARRSNVVMLANTVTLVYYTVITEGGTLSTPN